MSPASDTQSSCRIQAMMYRVMAVTNAINIPLHGRPIDPRRASGATG